MHDTYDRAEMIDEFIREYEAKWLDEGTPGRTSAERLRFALGLE